MTKIFGMPIHSRIPFITVGDVPLLCLQCCSDVCVHSTAYAAQHILSLITHGGILQIYIYSRLIPNQYIMPWIRLGLLKLSYDFVHNKYFAHTFFTLESTVMDNLSQNNLSMAYKNITNIQMSCVSIQQNINSIAFLVALF
jgi:hypothetical protein